MNKRGQYFSIAMIVVLIALLIWIAPFSRSIKFEKKDTIEQVYDNFIEELPFVVNTGIIDQDIYLIDKYIQDYSQYARLKNIDMRVFYIISNSNESRIHNGLEEEAILIHEWYNITVIQSSNKIIKRNNQEYVLIGTEEYYFNTSNFPSISIVAKFSQGNITRTYPYNK